jgi:hypothetical protein
MQTLFPQKAVRDLHRSSSHGRATVTKLKTVLKCKKKKKGVMMIKPDV